jgi:hypothetical protein
VTGRTRGSALQIRAASSDGNQEYPADEAGEAESPWFGNGAPEPGKFWKSAAKREPDYAW